MRLATIVSQKDTKWAQRRNIPYAAKRPERHGLASGGCLPVDGKDVKMAEQQRVYAHVNSGKPSKVFHYERCRCTDAHPRRESNPTEGKRPCANPECRPPEAKR
jgi:hypothetical protein